MLKERISYEDFDENPVVEDLYFNLTRDELLQHIDLKDRFEKMQFIFQANQQAGRDQLTPEEVQEMLDLIKTLMKMAYGVRSDDGKRFIKSEEIWTEFTQTAAYDTFLFSLFEQPEKAVRWMTGILPKQLREEAAKAAQALPNTPAPVADVPLPGAETSVAIKEKDPKDMTHEELLEAYRQKNQEQ